MSELKGPVIVVDDNTETAQDLLVSFQSFGWQHMSAKNLDELQTLCTDPFNQPIVITAQYLQSLGLDDESLSNFFSHYYDNNISEVNFKYRRINFYFSLIKKDIIT